MLIAYSRSLLFMFLLFFVSKTCFAHIAGVTDTGVMINGKIIDVVYTLPIDNINEFSEQQKSNLDNTIINGFLITNVTGSNPQDKTTNQTNKQENVENNVATKTQCPGEIISTTRLEKIQSEQFKLKYICPNNLDVLTIEYSLFIKEFEKHENYVRLSISGRSQSFTFSVKNSIHEVPISSLLTRWNQAASKNGAKTLETQGESTKIPANPSLQKNSFLSLLGQSTHYFAIGIEHILLGYDHVLFLIGLLLLPLGFRGMILFATSFTIAHSITLALSVLGVFTLPVLFVEVLIALSIVYIAIENILVLRKASSKQTADDTSKPSISTGSRVAVTFAFGLLHGFGFSYVLKEIGLGEHIVGSLLFFNLGVEIGQLVIVAIVFPIMFFIFKRKSGFAVSTLASIIIGAMGAFWFVERLLSAF